MVPKTLLDDIAKFPVRGIMVESKEVTLLGKDFIASTSLPIKNFWKEYRKCLKQIKHTR